MEFHFILLTVQIWHRHLRRCSYIRCWVPFHFRRRFSGRKIFRQHRRIGSSLTTFRINTYISVASKRLYLPLESTLMKKPGEGGGGCQGGADAARLLCQGGAF